LATEKNEHEKNCKCGCAFGSGCTPDKCVCGENCKCGDDCDCDPECNCKEDTCNCEHEEKCGPACNCAGTKQGEKTITTEDYIRMCADFDNYRKHAEKKISSAHNEGKCILAGELLPVIDDLDSAIIQTADLSKANEKEITQGVASVRSRLLAILRSHGLEEMPSGVGNKFDHNLQEAIQTSPEVADGVVATELRKGYLFRGNVLRHAMVVVGSKKN